MNFPLSFPLQNAFLCPDCDYVGNNPMRCTCGNALQLHSLAAVLNRTTVSAEAQAVLGTLAETMRELRAA